MYVDLSVSLTTLSCLPEHIYEGFQIIIFYVLMISALYLLDCTYEGFQFTDIIVHSLQYWLMSSYINEPTSSSTSVLMLISLQLLDMENTNKGFDLLMLL